MAEVTTLAEAVNELVSDGDSVALEGFTHLIPFAAGHEIARQGRRDLELIRMTPDVLYDQLIGLGVARKLVFSYGGNPGVGSLHRFRDAIEHDWPRAAGDRGAQPRRHGQPLRGRRVPAAVRRDARLRRHRPGRPHRTSTVDLPVHRRGADRGAGADARRDRDPRPAGRPGGQRAAVGHHRRAEGGGAGRARARWSRSRRSWTSSSRAPARWSSPAGWSTPWSPAPGGSQSVLQPGYRVATTTSTGSGTRSAGTATASRLDGRARARPAGTAAR